MTDHDLECAGDRLRQELLPARNDAGDLNGIDYLEIGTELDPNERKVLRLYFLRTLPAGSYGLDQPPYRIKILGGVRIVAIQVTQVTRDGDHLKVEVDRAGDHSTYRLVIEPPGNHLDPRLSHIEFSFMATCPSDVDCLAVQQCPPMKFPELNVDYLAKDYASFRRLLLDLLPQLNPDFVERNPSDLGIALVELLAYLGDQLSYQQDAVANEGFLFTARHRISARRHARLLDYRMHDGRNAWTFVHFDVQAGMPVVPAGTQLMTRPSGEPPDPITPEALTGNPVLANVSVFETRQDAQFDPANNEIRVHTWGDRDCCLPEGGTEAYLFSVIQTQAITPKLSPGDFLLFEEVLGPASAAAADADPTHRQVVVLTAVDPVTDSLFSDRLPQGKLIPWDGTNPLPLLHVRWRTADALRFPVCLSASPRGLGPTDDISVARGNLVLADHGLSVTEPVRNVVGGVPESAHFRLPLVYAPLTIQAPKPGSPSGAANVACDVCAQEPRPELGFEVQLAAPQIELQVTAGSGEQLDWKAVPDLLESTPLDPHFVAEIDEGGQAFLRFGDGEYGRSVAGAMAFRASYRIGNGRTGNIAADSLHRMHGNPGLQAFVDGIRNPLPARDGVDPETIEEVRIRAPRAFQAIQCRAVTEADYAAAAKSLPSVADATAAFRWTGSWYTVFLSVKPKDLEASIRRDADGRFSLVETFAAAVLDCISRYRLAGYDLELRPPSFVPIRLDITVCVDTEHFRADVAGAVRDALVTRPGAAGGALFDPTTLGFGQPIFLSQVYRAVQQVQGVDSSQVTALQRYWGQDSGELASGVFEVGPWEIPELANDPNFREHGVLNLAVLGGKG
jgi:hypothetical protein